MKLFNNQLTLLERMNCNGNVSDGSYQILGWHPKDSITWTFHFMRSKYIQGVSKKTLWKSYRSCGVKIPMFGNFQISTQKILLELQDDNI